MLQAEASPGAIQQRQKDDSTDFASRTNSSTKETVIFIARSLVTLWIAALVLPFFAIALAQAHESKSTPLGAAALSASGAREANSAAFDLAALPSPDSIDAQTDITLFLQDDVPAELHRAALRRAWIMNRAIRDFKEMGENDWNFDYPDSIPGFGALGSEVDVRKMVAQIMGEPTRLASVGSAWRLRHRQ